MDKEKVSLQCVLEYIPAGTYKWLSGRENASETQISWITCGTKEAQPGDLVLLPSVEILTDLFSTSFFGPPAAIGIVGDGEIDLRLLPNKPVIRFRNASDIPSVSLRSIHQLLLRSLLSQRSMVLEQSASIQTRLTQIAARGEGLTSLAAAMREMTQHGILVQDKRLSPLVSSPTASLRDVWDDLLAQLSDFSTLPEILRDRRRAGEEPTTIFTALPGGL
ncbi:MAG: hypothetical protein ACK2UB_10445, partial [Anaerolineales bacterium]